MRTVTWNMGYWGHASAHEAAWRWLLDELSPDVALLQECVVPSWVHSRATVLFDEAYPESRNQRWGTALVTKDLETVPARLQEIETWLATLGDHAPQECSAARLQGWCVPAYVSLPNGSSALIISIHNPAFPIERSLVADRDLTSIKLSLNSDVWLLDVVFHFLRDRLGEPLLIGGDFNYSRVLDDPAPRGNNEFFDRLANNGFISLTGASTTPTSRPSSTPGGVSTSSITCIRTRRWPGTQPTVELSRGTRWNRTVTMCPLSRSSHSHS